MQIHVVKPGQTVSSIARHYGVDAAWIRQYNGLTDPDRLAVGQSLVILRPAEIYTVQPGDTLYTIAVRNGTTPRQLLRNNPDLKGQPQLTPGQTLVLRLEDAPEAQIQVHGYAYPFVQKPILEEILPFATYLAPFTYKISRENTLIPLDDLALIELARSYGVSPLMHVSNLSEEDVFSPEIAARVLQSPASQAAMTAQVVAQMQRQGYDGIDVDFERVDASDAAAYAAWLDQLRGQVQAAGGILLAALAPKTSGMQPGQTYEGHDYAAIGRAVDAVLLMTYEWGYRASWPRAVAPLEPVRQVVEYAVGEIGAEKLLLGIPNYGYDWPLPFVAGQTLARSLSNPEAVQLAVDYGAEIQFDQTQQTPWFQYTDGQGQAHEVWFEDARSCRVKYELVSQYGLRGVGFWNFMRPFAQGFQVLNAMFQIQEV